MMKHTDSSKKNVTIGDIAKARKATWKKAK